MQLKDSRQIGMTWEMTRPFFLTKNFPCFICLEPKIIICNIKVNQLNSENTLVQNFEIKDLWMMNSHPGYFYLMVRKILIYLDE